MRGSGFTGRSRGSHQRLKNNEIGRNDSGRGFALNSGRKVGRDSEAVLRVSRHDRRNGFCRSTRKEHARRTCRLSGPSLFGGSGVAATRRSAPGIARACRVPQNTRNTACGSGCWRSSQCQCLTSGDHRWGRLESIPSLSWASPVFFAEVSCDCTQTTRRVLFFLAVTNHQFTVANGNHTIPGRSHRIGVTSDEAENAPRLTVTYS
jgi:hypothetical protein